MKKLNKFLLQSYLGPLILTFFIGVFVLLMQFLWKYVDDLVGKGLDMFTIGKFVFYACWTFVPMALPLAVLLSSLMFFGNMGEHYELVALKAAGIPLRRSMRPLIFVCMAVCLLAFYFANYAVPKAYLNYQTLYYEIRTKKPALNIPEGIYYKQIEGYTIRVGEKEDDGAHLKDVQIYDHTARKGNTRVTMAETGFMQTTPDGKHMTLTLYNGYSYGEDDQMGGMNGSDRGRDMKSPFTKLKFEKQILLFDLSSFQMPEASETMFRRHEKTLGLRRLNKQIDTSEMRRDNRCEEIMISMESQIYHLSRYGGTDSVWRSSLPVSSETEYVSWKDSIKPNWIATAAARAETYLSDAKYYKDDMYYRNQTLYSYEVEWHKKFSLSAACLILFFIGAPLGSIIRKGGMGMPVVMSVLLFVIYHVISVIGEKSAIEGVIPCFWGLWMAPLIYLPFGLFLTVQATMDSSFLDADTWKRVFQKKYKSGK